jgi:hypothetical protein
MADSPGGYIAFEKDSLPSDLDGRIRDGNSRQQAVHLRMSHNRILWTNEFG